MKAPRERLFSFPRFLSESSSQFSFLSRGTLDILNQALYAAINQLADGLHSLYMPTCSTFINQRSQHVSNCLGVLCLAIYDLMQFTMGVKRNGQIQDATD